MFEAPRQSQSAVLTSANQPAALSSTLPAPIDFIKIFQVLWQGRTTILLTTVATLVLAALFVLFTPQRFTSTTEILIDPMDLHAVGTQPTPSVQASDTALLVVDSQVRVLTSDDVLRRVVVGQRLDQDPEFVGASASLRALIGRLLSALRGKLPARADPTLTALHELRRHMQVRRAERTYVVDVSVTSKDPAKAARLANAIAQAYLAQQTQVRFDAARQVSQSLGARLSDLKERVRKAEDRVEAFRAQHNIVNANGRLINEQQLSDLDNQLAAARARTAAARARLDQIEAVQKAKPDLGAFPEAVQSPTVTALRSQYAEVVRREAEQMSSLGARHPAVIEIQAQAARLKRMIDDEVNRIALSARADYESARVNEELLANKVDALKKSALATDAELVTLRELQRDVQASRAVYEAFLVRARETGEQERVDTKNIQVISKADLPLSRTWPPSNAIIALGAIFLGIAAGSGLVMLRDMLQGAAAGRGGPSLRDRPEIGGKVSQPADESRTAVPVLAQLPGVDTSSGPGGADDPNSRFATGIHKVYDALRASHHKHSNPSILLLASAGASDTAAVALTLAALAATRERVLLIDADLQRRTLSAIDADRSDAGLVDVAVGRRRLADAVIRDRGSNINLMPFVSTNSRRDRRISDEDIKRAFAQAKSFDMVIVTAIDVSRDPSARFFAGLVDHIVLVAKADEADAGVVDRYVAVLGVDARKVRGAVLTDAA